MEQPSIIQGGMGVAVSGWRLARAVAEAGGLGVVSGTALDAVLARRLQDGDCDGAMRRALAHFPDAAMARRVQDRYFLPGGRKPGQSYRPIPQLALEQSSTAQELAVTANFVEVWLAKEGHRGTVGINYLEKVQMGTPAAALGAILAGVDYVLMGAGVPREIPGLLDDLAAGRRGGVTVDVQGAEQTYRVEVDPGVLLGVPLPQLKRPRFLAIISSAVLAAYLVRNDSTCPDGFVLEGAPAGGHNAPPRGKLKLDDDNQPVYGPRDEIDVDKVAALGLPFWLAGAQGTPAKLAEALAVGAAGVQVGTLFALSRESGLRETLRSEIHAQLADDTLTVHTDPHASPTGFPFKVARLADTLADEALYDARPRLCDLSYLRAPYVDAKGKVGYRCPSEPTHMYLRKGGKLQDTIGRKCLCNALTADVGLGQTRSDGYTEPAMVTLGSDLDGARMLSRRYPTGWAAAEVVAWLTSDPELGRGAHVPARHTESGDLPSGGSGWLEVG